MAAPTARGRDDPADAIACSGPFGKGFSLCGKMELILAIFFMSFSAGCLTGTCIGLWLQHQHRDMTFLLIPH
jgi:hypothetical protein